MRRLILPLVLFGFLAFVPAAAGAQDGPIRVPREIMPQNVAPPTVVITPSAAERIIELMTLYTVTVAGGLAGGAFLTSLLTRNVAAIVIGSVAGAALAMGGYASYVSGARPAQPATLF